MATTYNNGKTVLATDKVTTTARKDIYGTTLARFVNTTTYSIIKIGNGSNGFKEGQVVIGLNGVVTAVVNASTLTKVGSSNPNESTTKKTTTKTVATKAENEVKMSSKAIEDALTNLLYVNNTSEIFKYSMRLFGVPAQYTDYCDYRSFSPSVREGSGDPNKLIGRKFIENIMLEAPVVTIIPGKPKYLPGNKNKQSTSYLLMSAASGSVNEAVAASALKTNSNNTDKLRLYDFEQDYITYYRYVDLMCGVAAGYLDLDNETMDGTGFSKYSWKNYRWKEARYTTAIGTALSNSPALVKSLVTNLKTIGKSVLSTINPTGNKVYDADDEAMSAAQELLTRSNYIQFYVDSSASFNEGNSNNTASSKMESIFDSAHDLMNEVAFMGNSGGLELDALTDHLDEFADGLNSFLFDDSSTKVGGVMSRILSVGSNVLKGENVVIPEIYQNSKYSKSYSISVDLRSPYGNKYSYFLNVLVPLFHLLCLAIPKQTTANTYSAPFIIKAYYPGVFACNLGIVKQITIDKNIGGHTWTADGYPAEMKVTLDIDDLYADLTMSDSQDYALFLSNTSLIEFIATNCGVNLTVPQLADKVKTVTIGLAQKIQSIPEAVVGSIFGGTENYLMSYMGI
jgi:hypothetical protein